MILNALTLTARSLPAPSLRAIRKFCGWFAVLSGLSATWLILKLKDSNLFLIAML
jgi:hypothetical protein